MTQQELDAEYIDALETNLAHAHIKLRFLKKLVFALVVLFASAAVDAVVQSTADQHTRCAPEAP